MKKIAVFTSGGDAPGMNAAVRSVVRTGVHHNIDVYAIMQGYKGMINGEIVKMNSFDVSGIIQKGGTIIKTARSEEFRTPEGRQKAFEQLKKFGIEGVVVIGGDGSFRGASQMIKEFDLPFIGIPGTIDNDIAGTDYTIGFDTALNTVIEAVDKIRDTAGSHDRVFFIEVMGKDAGFIALRSGIASGAEGVLIPEVENQHHRVLEFLKNHPDRKASIFIVAEGDEEGDAIGLANKVKNELPHFDVRTSLLGHIQRGGSPSCKDRVVASQMGVAATEALLHGKKNIMIGTDREKIVEFPLHKTVKVKRKINEDLIKVIDILI